MKSHGHEIIQKYFDGQASPEEAAALSRGLKEDADLRALYLDYVNLDMALSALADAATLEENAAKPITSLPMARADAPSHPWRWAAAAAVMAALVLLALLPRAPKPARPDQDVAAAIASSQNAIARLALDTRSALPAWMSPTASLLESPTFPQ